MDRYPDDIPEEVKKRRNNDLLFVQNANCLVDHRVKIGQTLEVLVEGLSRHGERSDGVIKQYTGRAMTDHIVVFEGTDRLIGQTLQVHIDNASGFTLFGTVITTETSGSTGQAIPTPRAANSRIGLKLV